VTDAGRPRNKTWRLTKFTIRRLLYPYFRVQIIGLENLKIERSVIVAPTHRSNLDSPLLGAAGSRRVRALSKESLFKKKPFAWYLSRLGAFPVKRGSADRESMRVARDLLELGEPLLVFPEGTRQTGNTIGEMFDGTAYMAAKSNAPVIPIGIAGTEAAMPPGAKFPRRSKVTIVIGKEIPVPGDGGRVPRSALRQFTADIEAAMQEALDRAVEHSEGR
jgi:1-acyl-sn-glycerol-3-phosphate acyltransferase